MKNKKIIISTICESSWIEKSGLNKMLNSLKYFHPDWEVKIYDEHKLNDIYKNNIPGHNLWSIMALTMIDAKREANADIVVHIDADSIILGKLDQILEDGYDIFAVRKRPGMYIGTTDSRGLMHCLWEIIDNSVDEALAGFCKKIIINLEKDGSVEVQDDGRGIPVDKEPRTGLTGVEVVMTKLHAGGKFGTGSYAASGGLHGVGASVVNALASRLDVEVDRNGKIHWISFKRGIAGVFDGDGPNASFTEKAGLRVTGKVSSKITGTRTKKTQP